MRRINITVSDKIYDYLEELKEEEKVNRSEIIRRAIILYKNELDRKLKEKQRKERVAKAVQKINELRESTGIWNGVNEIRKFRDSREKNYR